jgi:hypothetical protein
MDKDTALKLALEALEAGEYYIDDLEAIVYGSDDLGTHEDRAKMQEAITAIKQALATPVQEPVLQEIEQYRMQMAGISTAAIGYWKEDDGIHPDYDTLALRDVAKLYAKYDALYTTPPAVQRQWVGLTDEEFEDIELGCRSTPFGKIEAMKKVEAKLKERNV